MKQGIDLTTAPINQALLLFALPTLGSSILQSANGSIDTIWIGQLLGENALAATTNGNLVMFLLTAFVFGFGMASTILIGQAFGRRDVETARAIAGTTVGTFVPLSIVVAIIGWLLAPKVLDLLGTPEAIEPLARAFLQVTFLAMPAILMQTTLMMALRGSGDAMTPLIFMGMAVLLDIALNPLFILGWGPLPALGIAGSALATAAANYISLAAMLYYIYYRDLPLRLRGEELWLLVPDRELLRLIFTKGLPMGVQMIVVSSSMLTMMRLVNQGGRYDSRLRRYAAALDLCADARHGTWRCCQRYGCPEYRCGKMGPREFDNAYRGDLCSTDDGSPGCAAASRGSTGHADISRRGQSGNRDWPAHRADRDTGLHRLRRIDGSFSEL